MLLNVQVVYDMSLCLSGLYCESNKYVKIYIYKIAKYLSKDEMKYLVRAFLVFFIELNIQIKHEQILQHKIYNVC